MRILVDADACPVVALVEETAKKYIEYAVLALTAIKFLFIVYCSYQNKGACSYGKKSNNHNTQQRR